MHTKKTINEMKRQPSEYEEIFANKAMNEGLISKIYKHLVEPNIKTTTTTTKTVKKMGGKP